MILKYYARWLGLMMRKAWRHPKRYSRSLMNGATGGVATALVWKGSFAWGGNLLGVLAVAITCIAVAAYFGLDRTPRTKRVRQLVRIARKRVFVFLRDNFAATPDISAPAEMEPSIAPGGDAELPASQSQEFMSAGAPARAQVTVLHGSIRKFNAMVEGSDPEELARKLNEFFALASGRVKASGGRFERFAGASFVAFWPQPSPAIACTLALRRDFLALNEALKVDGQHPLSFGMGVTSGVALTGRIGSPDDLRFSAVGEVLACARALEQLSAVAGQDILVTGEIARSLEKEYFGQTLGEAKLTNDSGLTEYWSVEGYFNEQGYPVKIESPYAHFQHAQVDSTRVHLLMPSKKLVRWLVNNGSQIVGPFTSEQISAQLYSQELDFDCECWRENAGTPLPIRESGMFGGADGALTGDAEYWIFDGEVVHGPLAEGFIRTALTRQAVSPESYICQGSTIQGWKKISDWLATLEGAAEGAAEAATDASTGRSPQEAA